MQDEITEQVFRTIVAISNDVQSEWVCRRTLYISCVAHGDLDPPKVQQALYQLGKENRIETDDDRYRVVDTEPCLDAELDDD